MNNEDKVKYIELKLKEIKESVEEKDREIERLNELVKGLREERDYLFNKTTTESNYEIERLQKENNDLRKLYQRTYKHLFEKGNDELARYFQAQIDECPTFYVEPIIDYYKETERLKSIIKEVREYLTDEGVCILNKGKKENERLVWTWENYYDLLEILDKVGETDD